MVGSHPAMDSCLSVNESPATYGLVACMWVEPLPGLACEKWTFL